METKYTEEYGEMDGDFEEFSALNIYKYNTNLGGLSSSRLDAVSRRKHSPFLNSQPVLLKMLTHNIDHPQLYNRKDSPYEIQGQVCCEGLPVHLLFR